MDWTKYIQEFKNREPRVNSGLKTNTIKGKETTPIFPTNKELIAAKENQIKTFTYETGINKTVTQVGKLNFVQVESTLNQDWIEKIYKQYLEEYKADLVHKLKIGPTKSGRREIMVVDLKTGKVGKSICNPKDTYNDKLGTALAYARLRKIDIPKSITTTTIRDYVGGIVKLQLPDERNYYVVPFMTVDNQRVELIDIFKPNISRNVSADMVIMPEQVVTTPKQFAEFMLKKRKG